MSFQPRSSRLPPPIWPKPWGFMAGRAAPLRREVPRRERRKVWVRWSSAAPLLADDAAAEATDRTRTDRHVTLRHSWRSEHGAAEILFEAVRNIFPQRDHFAGGTAPGI